MAEEVYINQELPSSLLARKVTSLVPYSRFVNNFIPFP